MANLLQLERLRISSNVEMVWMAPNDFRYVLKVVSCVQPQEIDYLAGQTSLGLVVAAPRVHNC
jgi:GDPmannose 4,6-dehydratase